MVAAPLLLSGDIGAGLGFLRRALPSAPPVAATPLVPGSFAKGRALRACRCGCAACLVNETLS